MASAIVISATAALAATLGAVAYKARHSLQARLEALGHTKKGDAPSDPTQPPRANAILDPHLPKETEEAVIIASTKETNPTPLRSFAEALLPDFPGAASTLLARATVLSSAVTQPSTSGFNLFKSIASDAAKIGPLAFIPGAGAAIVLATGVAAAGHTKAPIVKDVKKAVDKLNQNKIFHTITKAYSTGLNQANPAYFAATLVGTAADETLHGRRLDKAILDQRQAVTGWLSTKAQYATSVAGLPPATAPALSGAAAVASGKPIPAAVIDVAAKTIPGGPVAQDALRAGATFGVDLASGKKVDKAALDAMAHAKSLLPTAEAQHAFDVGVTLAVGKKLQDTGFAGAQDLIKAESAPGKVLSALNMRSKDLVSSAVKNLQRALPANAAATARQVSEAIVRDPSLAHLSPAALAQHLGVTEPVARGVLASTSHEVPGSPIVHSARMRTVFGAPPAPPRLDPARVHTAVKANRGDASAQRQISYAHAQAPQNAGMLAHARKVAQRLMWTKHYLNFKS